MEYETCSHCDGEAYFSSTDFTFKTINVPCPHCCGLGWNIKVETVEVDNMEKKIA